MSQRISIEALSYLKAPIKMTSNQLERQIGEKSYKRFGIEIGLLKQLSGVKERRYWKIGDQIHEKAAEVASMAIKEAGISNSDVGCLINASVSHDYLEPTLAVMIHNELGLSSSCLNFDIGNACTGFATAIQAMEGLLLSRKIKYGVIVAAESSRRLHDLTVMRLAKDSSTFEDFKNEFASLTLGSGAVAMVLCREEDSKTSHRINGILNACDSRWNMLTYGKTYDQLICNAHEMLVKSKDVLEDIKEKIKSNWKWHEKDNMPDFIIPHQVSKVHEVYFNQYASEIPSERIIYIYKKLGNIGPAAWPIALYLGDKEHDFTGKHIGIASIGSGFNVCALDITW